MVLWLIDECSEHTKCCGDYFLCIFQVITFECYWQPYCAVSHLHIRVLSVRPLGWERQIHKIHQVVVAIFKGFKAVICLDHLKNTHWDSWISINRPKLWSCQQKKEISASTSFHKLNTLGEETRVFKESRQGGLFKAGKKVKEVTKVTKKKQWLSAS